jgi:hypothetical protein
MPGLRLPTIGAWTPGRGVRGGGANLLNLTATTSGSNKTVTITQLTPSGVNCTVIWGDGTANSTIASGYAGTTTHVYATGGTYNIIINNARSITQIRLDDAQLGGLNTAQLRSSPITYFRVTAITGSTIKSSDMTAWRPTTWYLSSMPTGTYNIASSDMSAWRPTTWYMFSMPAGTYNIASSDMTAWRPTTWYMYSMPAGTYTINTSNISAWNPSTFDCHANTGSSWTITSSDFNGWTACNSFRNDGNGLTQAQVDATLQSLYAAFASKSVAGGTINVAGSNSTPSGSYIAANPPVNGKEWAYSLVNDNVGINPTHKWTTVTIS